MSAASEQWMTLLVALSAALAGIGTAVAIVRRRDLPGWVPAGLGALTALPLLLRPPVRDEVLYDVVHDGQAAPWALALVLGVWVPAVVLPAALHPGPDPRPTPARAGVALAVAGLILVPSAVWAPSPLPVFALAVIVALTLGASRTSDRLALQRRSGSELAAVAAAVVFAASAVWGWFTSSALAWSALAVVAVAAVVTDRPLRLGALAGAAFTLSAAHQLYVTKGGVEAWWFELRGGVLPSATAAAVAWDAYDPVPDPIAADEAMGAQPVLLVDARTAWDELAFPAIPVVKARFVTSGPDGYAFAVAPVVAEAHAIALRRIDDQRVTLGGSPPFPMSELASAISSTHEHCATIPLLLLSGDWRVGEVLQADSGITRRATGICRWQDGDWVDAPP